MKKTFTFHQLLLFRSVFIDTWKWSLQEIESISIKNIFSFMDNTRLKIIYAKKYNQRLFPGNIKVSNSPIPSPNHRYTECNRTVCIGNYSEN